MVGHGGYFIILKESDLKENQMDKIQSFDSQF